MCNGMIKNEVRTERVEWVDAAKAFAVLLVVVGHVIDCYGKFLIIYDFIYLFHMPFFFLCSGVVAAIMPIYDIRGLLRREINLWGPTIIFLLLLLCVRKGEDIFFFYNMLWFLPFLALIIFMDYCVMKAKIKILYFLPLVMWFGFGLFQLLFVMHGDVIYAKFACEISKFFGYFVAFKVGTVLYKKRDEISYKKKSFFLTGAVGWFGLASVILAGGLQGNISLTKIPMGIWGGVW